MKIETMIYSDNNWQFKNETITNKSEVDLVLVFGTTDTLSQKSHCSIMKKKFPNAQIIGSSSSGNVLGSEVSKNDIVATVISLEKGYIKTSIIDFTLEDDLNTISKNLVNNLPNEDLKFYIYHF